MTVRPRPSITLVAGPRRRIIFSFPPMALTFPSEIAIAWPNEGTPLVAILALCKMISADTLIPSSFSNHLERTEASFRSLLVSYGRSGHVVFWEFGGRSAVYHGVRVLHSYPISSVMVFHNVHHGIVSFLVSPIALPFQHG